MAESPIEIKDLLRLKETWDRNNWHDNVNQKHVFATFCKILPNFSEEQRLLIHELTENYLWLSGREYDIELDKLANSIDKHILEKCKTLYLFPIVRPSDEKKTKSGNHCIYYLKGNILSFNPLYQDMAIEVINTYEDFQEKKFASDGSEVLLLVDDFIGSGETFNEAWNKIQKNKSVDKSFTFVFSIILQNEAFEIISKLGFRIYYNGIRMKGISDFYASHQLKEKTKTMEDIEEMIEPLPLCRFGYKRSEALITLVSTPDNTFPFFWSTYELNGISYKAPFLRRLI